MLNKKSKVFVLLIALSFASYSQTSKGDEFYAQSEYFKAIPYFKRETRSGTDQQRLDAHIKLANSYRLINDYRNAERYFKKALEIQGEIQPEVYFNYASVLKINGKYEEASEQYFKYIKLSPNDDIAKNALKFCLEIKYYLSKPIEYDVKNIEKINTEKAEFSPFVMDNKLMFIAERVSFDFVNYEVNDYNGQPFLNMYVSNLEGTEVKKSKAFSKKLNSEYHEGPACLAADGKTLYFTRVSNKSTAKVNNSRIYTAEGSNRNWKNIKELQIGGEDYSVGHPSISTDGNRLFFSSNMPGGFGGKDIWVCKRNGETWDEPVNLGPDINTSGDEMFPSLRKDGMLYFASDGLPGFGGLDIYSAKNIDGKWILNRNEGLNVNSSRDDFGITFLNDSVGYFSSNRAGGKGSDDIYLFSYTNRSMEVAGTVLLTENARDFAINKKVVLLDENGNAIDSMSTDEKGRFSFKNLSGEKKYMAVIDETDPQFTGKARYYLAEKDSVIHRVSSKYGDRRFAFKNLPIDPNGLPDLYTEDDLVFAGTLMSGEPPVPLKNTKLKIVNEHGDVVEEATTNEFGAFAFRNIPSDQNYLVSIEESEIELPEGTKVTLTNKIGKEVRSFYIGKGKFSFKVLNSDKSVLEEMEAEDANLVMGIYGYMYDQDKKPIMNAKIRVKDEDGSNEQEFVTSEKGKFSFKGLSAEKDYIFEADENDPSLSGVRRIYIADSKGRIYKVVDLAGGKFAFKILEVDKFTLGEFVLEDPKLKMAEKKKAEEEEKKGKETVAKKEPKIKETPQPKEPKEEEDKESEVTVTVIENIYYAYGDYKLGPDGQAVLNRAAEVLLENDKLIMEISSHTDSQSSSSFNMGLSNRRAQTAVDYLVSKGISRSRLKARGYGESKLLNHCADGVECSDDEHKVNRRTEFKIQKPIKKN